MVLPGKMARETRTKFADLIKRYLAGDSTLVSELAENAGSTHPIHGLARQSLAQGAVQDDETRKRRRIMEELNIQKQTIEVEASRAQSKLMLMQTYQSLCPGQVMDDAARVMFKDQFLNMAMGDYGQRKRLTSGASTTEGSQGEGSEAGETVYENKPITVSTVASEMGLVLKGTDAQKIGVTLKKMYFARYQRGPTKHEQMVGGAMRNVNSYAERDKDMMKEAITNHFKL
jgi:hypothetical protein